MEIATEAPTLSQSRTRGKRKGVDMSSLSPQMSAGLRAILNDTRVAHKGKVWRGESGPEIRRETLEALFDRLLVKVVLLPVDERHIRRLRTAELTDIGRLVAERLELAARGLHLGAFTRPDDFEDATEAYGEAAE